MAHQVQKLKKSFPDRSLKSVLLSRLYVITLGFVKYADLCGEEVAFSNCSVGSQEGEIEQQIILAGETPVPDLSYCCRGFEGFEVMRVFTWNAMKLTRFATPHASVRVKWRPGIPRLSLYTFP